jgi:hypothetical protein
MACLSNIAAIRGRTLEFDPAENRFTNDEEANKLLLSNIARGSRCAPDKV